jgi:hypothetical protein
LEANQAGCENREVDPQTDGIPADFFTGSDAAETFNAINSGTFQREGDRNWHDTFTAVQTERILESTGQTELTEEQSAAIAENLNLMRDTVSEIYSNNNSITRHSVDWDGRFGARPENDDTLDVPTGDAPPIDMEIGMPL